MGGFYSTDFCWGDTQRITPAHQNPGISLLEVYFRPAHNTATDTE